MINILISIIYLLLIFSLTLFFYKKYGKVGLYIWMCISVIICNIQTIKLIDFMGITISLGNISYGAIFLTTDIINEKYGKDSTNSAIKLSFITMIIFTIIMKLFLTYIPSPIDTSQESLMNIFNLMPRITIASLAAYYFSQKCDAYIYNYLKNKFNKIWISNNGSTFISQIIDTILFCSISFAFSLPLKDIIDLSISMIFFKLVIALLDTPFMYIAVKIKNINEIN